MLVLAIDTSSAAVSAAVVEVRTADAHAARSGPALAHVRTVAERVTVDPRAHGERLAPQIETCLAQAGIAPAGLDAVVAGLGPGPFTGLRVGLVTAEMFGELLGIPCYGVCSLDAIAAALDDNELLVATDARRREVYWARYRNGVRQIGPLVSRPASVQRELGLAAAVIPQLVAAGAGARLYRDVLGFFVHDVDYPPLDGLVRVAADRILGHAPGEVLTPLYLRRPDAVEPGAGKPVSQFASHATGPVAP